jgi:SAM-dependent methyltransferase
MMSPAGKSASEIDQKVLEPKGLYVATLAWNLLVKLLKPEAGKSVLDVGCGTGIQLALMEKRGMEAFGLDISMKMLRAASARTDSSLLVVGDAHALPFKDDSFDCVSMVSTLEFVGDQKVALLEAARVSRSKVYLGLLGSSSLVGFTRKLDRLFGRGKRQDVIYHNVDSITKLIRETLPGAAIIWNSALFLPSRLPRILKEFEGSLSFRGRRGGGLIGVLIKLDAGGHSESRSRG